MKTILITITEPTFGTPDQGQPITYYTRRVEVGAIDPIVSALDASLKAMPRPRAKRRDAGKQRKPEAGQ